MHVIEYASDCKARPSLLTALPVICRGAFRQIGSRTKRRGLFNGWSDVYFRTVVVGHSVYKFDYS